MPYYEYDQNNSGGSFVIDDLRGLGPRVWILADTVDEANNKAMDIGIYFHGIANDRDCECCGDRWSRSYRDDGHDMPMVNEKYDFSWHDKIYVHEGNVIRTIDKPK